METLVVVWLDDVLTHDTGRGLFDTEDPGILAVPETHPENADRVRNIHGVLRSGPIADHVRFHDGQPASIDQLAMLHDPAYIEQVRQACQSTMRFTRTTIAGPGSWPAMLAAAGCAITATDLVIDGAARTAYALVRPPGHHASQRQADGYCFFNNTALAAEQARRRGLERVAVIDIDVHHGNGTQTIFYDRADVLTVSLHMKHGSWGRSHPETGAPDEIGRGQGAGYNVNAELPLGSGDHAYLRAFDTIVTPIIDQFRPELIIIACGQDANQLDPNGRQAVTMRGFHQLGARTRILAARHCDSRLVLIQEGGYARTYSAWCAHATLEGALGLEAALKDPLSFLPEDPHHADHALAQIRAALADRWQLPDNA